MTDTGALQAQLDALREAVYSGITTISYEGKTVTYRSLDEMRGIVAALERELGAPRGPVIGVIRSQKGW